MLNPFNVLDIKETEIYTKDDCFIILDKKDLKDFMVEYDDKFEVPGIVSVVFPKLEDSTQIITPYDSIYVLKSENYTEDKDFYKINYLKDEKIIYQDYVSSSVNFNVINSMLGGTITYLKNPISLLFLLNIALPQSDLVHIELIVANMFRDKNTDEPCRLTGDYSNSKIIGLGQIARNDSWLSSISFERIDDGISKALCSKKNAKMNPIEKVLIEDF